MLHNFEYAWSITVREMLSLPELVPLEGNKKQSRHLTRNVVYQGGFLCGFF